MNKLLKLFIIVAVVFGGASSAFAKKKYSPKQNRFFHSDHFKKKKHK